MDDEQEHDDVGDPVCWIDRLCPDCGAMPTSEDPATCWRCGRTDPHAT